MCFQKRPEKLDSKGQRNVTLMSPGFPPPNLICARQEPCTFGGIAVCHQAKYHVAHVAASTAT